MPLRTREDLRRLIHAERLDNFYLLFGAEEYLRERAARAITDAALKDAGLREFNEATFNLTERYVQDAIAAAEQLPMMASRRVIRLADFTKLKESDEEILTRFLNQPLETSVVIFIADDLDKRKRLSKTLLDVCTAVEFPFLETSELTIWARGALKEFNATADDATLAYLIGLLGNGARRLHTELKKLAAAAQPEGVITRRHIDSLTPSSKELSNFELADYLINGERAKAVRTVRQLLAERAEPVMLLGLIASQYRRLLITKEMMRSGKPEAEVFRVVALPFHKRKDFLATARRSNLERLTHGLTRIAAADVAIKNSLGGGQAGARMQLELLVVELTQ